jgi:hypothetical protein
MALSAAVQRRYRVLDSAVQNYRVANGVTIYLGAICAVANVSYVTTAKRGYLIPWDDLANGQYAGIAIGSPFNLSTSNTVVGNTSASPVVEASVETGELILEKFAVTGASAQSDVGKNVFASDDDTLTLTSGTLNRVGVVEYWYSSTTCDVRLFGRSKWLVI